MIRVSSRYAELGAATNFSFLRGASHPEEMVARAAELELAGLGIADRNSLAGIVRAHTYARENRLAFKLVVGARLVFRDGSPETLAYPRDRAAYGRLCRLLTQGNLRAPKGECWLDLGDLLPLNEGLQVIVLPQGKPAALARLKEAFGERPALRDVHQRIIERQQRRPELARQRRRPGEAGAHIGPIAGAGPYPQPLAKNLLQPRQRGGLGRRQDDDLQALAEFEEIAEIEPAFALRRAQIALGQQPAEPAIGGAVPGIGQHLGRAVAKD